MTEVPVTPETPRTTELGLTSLYRHSPEEIARLTARAVNLFTHGTSAQPLTGRCVAIWFQRTSTRTRTAFTVATARLGGTPIAYGLHELQTVTGETEEGTARVLGSMLDGIVVRAHGSSIDLARIQDRAGVPVINAMASDEHPTQGLSDLATLHLHLGSLVGRSVVYVGEGNDSANALMRAAAVTVGLRLRLLVPEGHELPAVWVQEADHKARATGGGVTQDHDVDVLDRDTDAVCTTRWRITGSAKADPQRQRELAPYMVDHAFLGRAPRAIFMHDLPAHWDCDEIGEVHEGTRSVALDQVRMKLYTAMAVLESTVGRGVSCARDGNLGP